MQTIHVNYMLNLNYIIIKFVINIGVKFCCNFKTHECFIIFQAKILQLVLKDFDSDSMQLSQKYLKIKAILKYVGSYQVGW